MVELAFSRLGGRSDATELLVVGPSLGTVVATLWGASAALVADRFEVVGWDLPGHGRSAPADSPWSVEDLASAVRKVTQSLAGTRRAWYAGVSLGGTVAFALGVEPGPFRALAAIASAPRIGDPQGWEERAALVRGAGMDSVVEGSALRWFAPGFAERDVAMAGTLLAELRGVDAESYALACDALGAFDLRPRLSVIQVPLLVAAGRHDVVLPPDVVRAALENASDARLEILEECGHLPPAEDPAAVADLLLSFVDPPGGER